MSLLRLSLAAACGYFVLQSSAFALDFTLRSTAIRAEALSLSATYISDADSKIMLRIPQGWKASDSPTQLDLIPPQPSCHVILSQVNGTQALALDPAGQAELLKKVVAELPGGAKNVEALPPVDNLLPINHWTSLEFTHRYDFYGQKLRRSVLFINMLPGRVVRMTVTAPDDTFQKIHDQARVLMSNWFEPKRDLPPELAREYELGKAGGG